MTEPSASILIRTKNKARNLGDCLEAVFSQEGASFEVIVLHSGSTDGTVEIARRFPVRLMTMRPEEFTYGYVLNVGFEAASHPYLVALSGHSIPLHRRWLANLLRHFGDPRVAGVSGPEVNRWNPAPPARTITLTRDNFFSDPVFSFSSFNSAIRREAWEQLPFHEVLPHGEDKVWAWQMVERISVSSLTAMSPYTMSIWSRRAIFGSGDDGRALGQAAWRDVRPYPLATVLRLGVSRVLCHVRGGQWGASELEGTFAYFHGRYTGFVEAHRHCVTSGPHLLPRPRQLPGLACGGTP